MSLWNADSDLDYADPFWRKRQPDAPRTVPTAEDKARAAQHAERRRYESTGVGGSLETRLERFPPEDGPVSDKYILDGHTPVPAADLLTWARWFDVLEHRRVAQTDFDGGYVSTVFLGLDHSFSPVSPPLLFETMIFGGPHADYQDRYSTWDEAEAGHTKAVQLATSAKEPV